MLSTATGGLPVTSGVEKTRPAVQTIKPAAIATGRKRFLRTAGKLASAQSNAERAAAKRTGKGKPPSGNLNRRRFAIAPGMGIPPIPSIALPASDDESRGGGK